MERFCVCSAPNEAGEHEVHRADCRKAPPPEERLDLGYFRDAWAALCEARQHYELVQGCKLCMPGCYLA